MDDISKDMQDFHALHPNNKLAVLGIILVAFIVAFVVGSYINKNKGMFNKNNPVPTEQTQPSGTDTTTRTVLTMTPSVETMKVGESATISVDLTSNPVQASDVVITFDPKMFRASDIVNGNVYEDLLINKIQTGRVTVSAAVSPNAPTTMKTGQMFSFKVTALQAGTGTFIFDPKLTITAKNGVNTLGSVQPVTITVQ
jgi:hypothetical protein